MSLRIRIALAAGLCVVGGLVIASFVIYPVVASDLRDQVDGTLVHSSAEAPLVAGTIKQKSGAHPFSTRPVSVGGVLVQIIPNPQTLTSDPGLGTINEQDIEVAQGRLPGYFRDAFYGRTRYRVYTSQLPSATDTLVRAAKPLATTQATLNRLLLILIGLTVAVGALAALMGRLAAGTVLKPIRNLAQTVAQIRSTGDLRHHLRADGKDEVAQLAKAFNSMTSALDASLQAQRQLVSDASHELRTPLTTHRANIELLARPDLPAEQRDEVLEIATRGIDELTLLVNDLIQAARNQEAPSEHELIQLHQLARDATERARTRAPSIRFHATLHPCETEGSPTRLARALDNILDNAIKWSPPNGTIDVTVDHRTVAIRDRGPGIDDDDLPHVFDRFYRAPAARSVPGSGLGLAIVKQTIEAHHGTIEITNAPDGGTQVMITLPRTHEAPDDHDRSSLPIRHAGPRDPVEPPIVHSNLEQERANP
jgi:two-component system, OmpR family, sensor histidine kinase MprB